ncbi:hypothetical protein [Poseidonibacter sp.]|uniref:hypothetical protein n=1 Tax=Poseidonibacter sp. TaxID=2321188 RepID=UPI003C75DEC2
MGFFKQVFKSVFKNIIDLSRPIFTFENNELKFKINSEYYYTFALNNYETKTRHDSYILEAYTINSDNLFVEYVHVDNDVTWNGLASSFFVNLFKEKLPINSMKIIEKKEFEHYEFITYKINDEFTLNFIYIYEINKDNFIIEKNAELYINLLQSFQKDYKYKFDKNQDLEFDINISIVKENALNGYFNLSN